MVVRSGQRHGRRLAQATTAALVVVAVCLALATTAPTAAAAAGSLADACGKVTSPSAAAAAVEECKGFPVKPGNAFMCDYIARLSNAAVGDSLAAVFTTMATGFPSGAHEAVQTVCALFAGKGSLAAACEAARDALAESDAAFDELCKASFNNVLTQAPPPPPTAAAATPPPPPAAAATPPRQPPVSAAPTPPSASAVTPPRLPAPVALTPPASAVTAPPPALD